MAFESAYTFLAMSLFSGHKIFIALPLYKTGTDERSSDDQECMIRTWRQSGFRPQILLSKEDQTVFISGTCRAIERVMRVEYCNHRIISHIGVLLGSLCDTDGRGYQSQTTVYRMTRLLNEIHRWRRGD